MSSGTVFQTWTEQLIRETCCNCGLPMAMSRTFYDARLADGRPWYCPAGHRQWYTRRQTEEERLRKERDIARRGREAARSRATHLADQLESTRRSKAAIKGHLTRLRNRIADGVCPECDERFDDVRDHIEAEHPEFADRMAQREAEVGG